LRKRFIVVNGYTNEDEDIEDILTSTSFFFFSSSSLIFINILFENYDKRIKLLENKRMPILLNS
jgi:hypothetical protein